MRKKLLLLSGLLLSFFVLTGCGNRNYKESYEVTLQPQKAEISLEQNIGADMAILDYANKDKVIFHGYFGLYVYGLKECKIIQSLDLKEINCDYTQGDAACSVNVSKDGNTVTLHPANSEKMYIYMVSDNTLIEQNYREMKDSFKDNLVQTKEAIKDIKGIYSNSAVKLESGEYGYLSADDLTIGSIKYVNGEKVYSLFKEIK